MKLPYRAYQVRRFNSETPITIWRPTTYVYICGPKGRARIRALVDSGADETLFPRHVADTLGISMDDGRTGSIEGVGQQPLGVCPGDAEIEITRGSESFRWPTTVCFAPVNVALLGHLGCLEFFVVKLDHARREFELEPNDSYPGRI